MSVNCGLASQLAAHSKKAVSTQFLRRCDSLIVGEIVLMFSLAPPPPTHTSFNGHVEDVLHLFKTHVEDVLHQFSVHVEGVLHQFNVRVEDVLHSSKRKSQNLRQKAGPRVWTQHSGENE